MIAKTACISFPRSGFHALKNVLEAYFGPEFVCCDNYVDPPEKDLRNCVETNFQKEHDLKLEYPSGDPALRYLILARNPIHSIQSWIDFDASVAARQCNTYADWKHVFDERMEFWSQWSRKWMTSEIWPRMVVFYEDLVAYPFLTISAIIRFMTEQHPDALRLEVALHRFPIRETPRRRLPWIQSTL